MKSFINIKIGGQAGEGIKVGGLTLMKALTRLGFNTFGYNEYPSLIRGGHNTYQIHASSLMPVYSQIEKIDLLLALNLETVNLHQKELKTDSLIIYNSDNFSLAETKLIGQYLAIPLISLAEKSGCPAIMANTVCLGAALSLLDLKPDPLLQILKETFSNKGQEVVALNHKAAQAGFDFVNQKFKQFKLKLNQRQKINEKMVLSGNEALALGAISAGLKFYCAYPMTPATSILHYLASKAEKYKIIVRQPEDEIAAINMAVGASFAGVRAMTATSGGGFCLMAEGLGLAGATETPIVIINSMRPGPSSGMPTWSGQGDLRFVIHASQDEFPRIVLAPGDAQEAFDLTRLAFQLAEKYQIPVIILMDKNISESDFCCPVLANDYKNKRYSFVKAKNGNYNRYQITQNGVSPRPVLASKGFACLTNSYEHSENGQATEDSLERTKMADKRNLKLKSIEAEIISQPRFGASNSEKGVISFGSNKGPIQQALTQLKNFSYLHLNWLWPFPKKQVQDFVKGKQTVYCLEANSSGQLAGVIQEQIGFKVKQILKYDGRPFYPEEIIEILKNNARQ